MQWFIIFSGRSGGVMVPLRIWWKILQERVLFWLPFNLSLFLLRDGPKFSRRQSPFPSPGIYSLLLCAGGQKGDTPDTLSHGFESWGWERRHRVCGSVRKSNSPAVRVPEWRSWAPSSKAMAAGASSRQGLPSPGCRTNWLSKLALCTQTLLTQSFPIPVKEVGFCGPQARTLTGGPQISPWKNTPLLIYFLSNVKRIHDFPQWT